MSPSDAQALGYQLLQQTIQSVFPEVNIVVPGNDFMSCGWWLVLVGGGFLSDVPLPEANLATHPGNSWQLFCPWNCIFPLGRKRENKQERNKNNKLGQPSVGPHLT